MPKDYSHLNKEELLKTIAELEDKVKHRYGLVWDEERTKEKFEQDAQNAYPVLREVKSRAIVSEETDPVNIMIEGDNYHALSVLQYTHKGKVDIIYIDPPYNTGSKDWKYNNDFVDINDSYRHSKWLSFMRNRLRIAKYLLKETGSLICAIDENEHARLGLLLEEIFPDREIVCVTIIHNPGGIQGKNFSYTHEYAYFVHPRNGTFISTVQRDDIGPTPLRDWGGKESKRETAKNCFYPILTKSDKIVGFGDVCHNTFHPKATSIKRKDGIVEIYPIDKDGVERKWRFARNTVESILSELKVETVNGELVIRRYKSNYRWKTVWTDKKYSSNTFGSQLLSQIIDEKFPYPKSLFITEDCLRAVIHEKKDAIILDFFAGSGTTAHAVLNLNKEDQGKRRFIVCTNNENNIATEVCFPRIEKVIKGYKRNGNGEKVDGLGGNLRYFKTAFVKQSIGRDELKIRITRECTEMLCIREGIYEEQKVTEAYKIFTQGDRVMAVYYDMDRTALKKLRSDLSKYEGDKILYCFTLDPLGLDQSDFADWSDVRLEPIPQKILDVYEEIHELHS